MTTPRKPNDLGKQLIAAALIFLAGTIVLSLVIVYDGEAQPLGQGGGYEPPLCLCATPSESPTPTETPRLHVTLIASPTPAPTNTQRPTSTTIARSTETPTQTATQRPTEAFNTPTPEVWQGGVVPTSIDQGGVLFTVIVPAGVVTHDWNGSAFIRRTNALKQGTAFTVDMNVWPYCRRDGLYLRVRSQENVWVPWREVAVNGMEFSRADNASTGKVNTEDCL